MIHNIHKYISIFILVFSLSSHAEPGLEFVEAFSGDGMESLLGVTISPDGKHLYTLSGHTSMGTYNAVNSYVRDQTTGRLTLISSHSYVAGINDLDNSRAFAISPDGYHCYISAHDNSSINIFERDPSGGDLTFLKSITADGLNYGNAIAVSPDNNHVYVASSATDVDNTIVAFSRDTVSGDLTFIEYCKQHSVLARSPPASAVAGFGKGR